MPLKSRKATRFIERPFGRSYDYALTTSLSSMPLAGHTTHTHASAHGHTDPSNRNQAVRAEMLVHMVRQAYRNKVIQSNPASSDSLRIAGLQADVIAIAGVPASPVLARWGGEAMKPSRAAHTEQRLFRLPCSFSPALDVEGVPIATTVSCQFRLCLIQPVIENAICAKDSVTTDWAFLGGLRVFVQGSSPSGTYPTPLYLLEESP